MHCQRCGNALAPGARFCNVCGTPVTEAPPRISLARPTLVTVLAVLHFLGGALMLILGGIGISIEIPSTQPDRTFGLALAALLLLFGLTSFIAGAGLWKMREWGRILQIVLAAIGLLGIPLGTIISILLLVYFTRPHIKVLFSGKRLDQLTPEETAALSATSGERSGVSAVVIALVALVVIIGFIGILAAIAIPNLLNAMERAKQKRTIVEMRGAAQIVEQSRGASDKLPETIPARKDGWGRDLRYVSDGTNYWIVSAGRDGKFEEDDVTHYAAGATTNFDADLVLENGEMQRAPEH